LTLPRKRWYFAPENAAFVPELDLFVQRQTAGSRAADGGKREMLLGLVLALLTAAAPGHAALSASLGERASLRPGQDLVVRGENLSVRFVSVLEDSRCPKGEQCLVAGRARIALDVEKTSEKKARVELATAEPPAAAAYAGYAITLLDLSPYPVTGRSIVPSDYVATLVVSSEAAALESSGLQDSRHFARRTRTHRAPSFAPAAHGQIETVVDSRPGSETPARHRTPFIVLNPAFEFP
jgi:hypothetical protein